MIDDLKFPAPYFGGKSVSFQRNRRAYIHLARESFNLRIEVVSQKASQKPQGLWFSIGWEWMEWCQTEMPGHITEFAYALDVDRSAVLTLRSEWQTRAFARKFGFFQERRLDYDWPAVAEKYKGLIINPWIQDLAFKDGFAWYYGWDVSSGCVWDTSCIRGVTKIEVPSRQE
jgi:hypothetical protein